VADVSVRSLAVELGVAKNTALRAIKTLRAAGVVEHRQRRDGGGRYDASAYRLMLPTDVFSRPGFHAQFPAAQQLRSAPAPKPVRKSMVKPAEVEQLVLLPVG
jgi:predicted DNA-binding transcriptional regulator YafY